MTMRGSGHILISQWKILNMIFMSHRPTTVDVPLESQGNYLLLAQKWMLTCILDYNYRFTPWVDKL